MAKEVQLKKNNVDVFPRTFDTSVAVSGGTKLLSVHLKDIDDTFTGIETGEINVGYSVASNKAQEARLSDLSAKATNAVNDEDGNKISTTYIKTADMSRITNQQIDALFQ